MRLFQGFGSGAGSIGRSHVVVLIPLACIVMVLSGCTGCGASVFFDKSPLLEYVLEKLQCQVHRLSVARRTPVHLGHVEVGRG